MKCKGPIRPILPMRTGGLSGPMFQHVAAGVCMRSPGAFIALEEDEEQALATQVDDEDAAVSPPAAP